MSEITIRRCKKCGCELVSTNKHKLCDACRRSRNGKFRNFVIGAGAAVASAAIFVLTKGRRGGVGKQ